MRSGAGKTRSRRAPLRVAPRPTARFSLLSTGGKTTCRRRSSRRQRHRVPTPCPSCFSRWLVKRSLRITENPNAVVPFRRNPSAQESAHPPCHPGAPRRAAARVPADQTQGVRTGRAHRLKTLSLKAYFSRRVRGGRWPWPGMSRNAVALMLSQSGPQSSKPSEREDGRGTREGAATVTSHTWASRHTRPLPSRLRLQPESWKPDDSPKTEGRRPPRGCRKRVRRAAPPRRRPRSPGQAGYK